MNNGVELARPFSNTWQQPLAYLREFYGEPLARIGLVLSTAILAYGGGAVMFWFHSIYLHKGGPAISPWLHWLLDSTAGFITLAPAIAVILPLTSWFVTRAAAAGPPTGQAHPFRFALVGGGLLAVVTAPAPLLHDRLIARDTWLGDEITQLWGNGYPAMDHSHEMPVIVEMVRQVMAGLPTYIVLMWAAFMTVRGCGHLISWRHVGQ